MIPLDEKRYWRTVVVTYSRIVRIFTTLLRTGCPRNDRSTVPTDRSEISVGRSDRAAITTRTSNYFSSGDIVEIKITVDSIKASKFSLAR